MLFRSAGALQISPHADIRETVIHFKLDPSESELLLKVPIEAPESAIVITLGTNSTALDKGILRMQLGLFDSDDNRNSFYIVDSSLYLVFPPCDPFEAIPGDNPIVSSGTRATSTFKFTFLPWDRMGYCATAQDEGYLSVGKFDEQLHGPLYLQIKSQYRGKDFYINHISIKSI